MILRGLAVAANLRANLRLVEDSREIQALGSPVADGPSGVELVRVPNHFVDRTEAEFGHVLAHFLSDEAHEVDYICWVAGESLAQFGVLCRHPHRTGIEMTDPHHDAAERHQGSGGKAEFLGSEECGDHHIAARLQLPVRFDCDTAAQIVEDQRLVRFSQTEFPGQPGMLNTGLRRRTCATVVPADQHHVRVSLGHACGDSAHPHFGDQLDADTGVVVGVLQVVNQLCQVFD